MDSKDERVARLEGGYEHLATKADIERMVAQLSVQLAEIRGEFRGIKWALITSIALAGITVAAVAFLVR